MRVLLVEDDVDLRDTLSQALRQAGYGVDALADGRAADTALSAQHYSLVVLDLGLPKLDGIQVLSRLRARRDWTPVLILTARDAVDERVNGLKCGADDYLTKPFALPELEARVSALMRRSAGGQALLVNGPLSLDLFDNTISLDGIPLDVGRREAAVLAALMRKRGQVVIKSRLAQQISDWDGEVGVNAVEVYVHRLRKKLEPHDLKIRTIHGLGYLLEKLDDGE